MPYKEIEAIDSTVRLLKKHCEENIKKLQSKGNLEPGTTAANLNNNELEIIKSPVSDASSIIRVKKLTKRRKVLSDSSNDSENLYRTKRKSRISSSSDQQSTSSNKSSVETSTEPSSVISKVFRHKSGVSKRSIMSNKAKKRTNELGALYADIGRAHDKDGILAANRTRVKKQVNYKDEIALDEQSDDDESEGSSMSTKNSVVSRISLEMPENAFERNSESPIITYTVENFKKLALTVNRLDLSKFKMPVRIINNQPVDNSLANESKSLILSSPSKSRLVMISEKRVCNMSYWVSSGGLQFQCHVQDCGMIYSNAEAFEDHIKSSRHLEGMMNYILVF